MKYSFVKWVLSFLFSGVLCSSGAFGQFNKSWLASNVEVSFRVDTLNEINTEWSEFSPMIHKDKLIFTSNREGDLLHYNMNFWSRNSYLSLFWVDIGAIFDSVSFRNVKRLSNKINIRDHTGPLVFGKDDETAFFTRVSEETHGTNGKKVRNLQLFKAHYKDGKWQGIQKLPFVDKASSYAHPAISEDGKRLYFVSNMEGGEGENDLFVSHMKNGEWSEPENMGAPINSGKNEMFPYYQDSTLFFSSNRSGGQGGLDLYCVVLKDNGEWTEPKNLGKGINSSEDDFGMVMKKNAEEGYFSSNRKGSRGGDDIYGFKVVEKVTVKKKGIAGQFEYRKIEGDVPSGMEVQMVDDKGEVVLTTTTNEKGEFQFRELPGDKDYTLRLKDSNKDVKLKIDGDQQVYLLKDDQGKFVYRKLEPDKVGTKSLIKVTDPELDPDIPDLTGQFVYSKLPSEKPGKRTVQLVDDEGNVVMAQKTDENGNFQFQEVPRDKNYQMRLKNAPDKDLTMMVYDRNGNVIAQMKADDDGTFNYRKLSSDKKRNLELIQEEDPQMEFDPSKTVYGQFEYDKLEKDVPEGLKVRVLNDEGKVRFITETDEQGGFRFVDLPVTPGITFDVVGDKKLEGELILKIIDKYGEVVAIIRKNDNGLFVYREIEGDKKKLSQMEEKDEGKLVVDTSSTKKEKEPDDGEKTTSTTGRADMRILFDQNSSYMTSEGKEALRGIADKLKNNPNMTLEIRGYASSPAPSHYNKWLSERRANRALQRLKELGVPASRMEAKGYGEQDLVNDCAQPEDCTDQQHAENRRVEFYFK